MTQDLELHYGYLFEKELLEKIKQCGSFKKIPSGSLLIDINSDIKSMPLILDGAIKILREDGKGNELIIYYIEQGDTCTMTLSCCMNHKKSKIRAITETDTKLIMIPIEKMSEWMSEYKSWQNFILQSYHDKMQEMLEAIDTIAFFNMDERLLKYLKNKAIVNHNATIHTTHQEIANDLHTSRVVISRVLKSLENKKKITLHRNYIQLIAI
ncbi:Crp/Fnr family transcriptional regulator [Tenacibaculum maritimum]|uniref:Transcriptional regulator, Crp/Fnr family n=1 Tax=Tenacibaculum maritimum NCIMB 2154 TaxID=1349785 RepID=A0A2H1ED19_9FLAO|nr:Crp/Fnr family transcriptional regulator [Tenacibaculum maritimum]MCD9562484.1 Crp/Fnr family transcriptional regulator [Tenacibaculum maritimum]MCD9564863.1 Crp/Fnr family transcriptional regulator [Tenacibaculum maritimum]MCD9577642.1 Crp/Fnr family transcriptional regulator [Tenacibaculum maritimum]MCD9581151.1 Crp/Fnr family transcriptional regulator [Tenacibaculum maritimum]MCD9583664.1 Crp/Fnr family transcriptional regulator [Tenacibaculum maritimum]